jgi:hypothetical protein
MEEFWLSILAPKLIYLSPFEHHSFPPSPISPLFKHEFKMWFNLHEWDYVKLVIGLKGYSTQNFIGWSESKDEVDNFCFVLFFFFFWFYSLLKK